MLQHSAGDIVSCKIDAGIILYASATKFERTHYFDIICVFDDVYLILVPADLFIKDSFLIDKYICKRYHIDQKFSGSWTCRITDSHVVSLVSKMDGMCCDTCDTFVPMASPNADDSVFVCWNCRTYKFYK